MTTYTSFVANSLAYMQLLEITRAVATGDISVYEPPKSVPENYFVH